MSKTRDFYIDRCGNDYNRVKNSLWYVSKLALEAAIALDHHTLGRNDDLGSIEELCTILAEYQLKDTHTPLTKPDFSYETLGRAMSENSDKGLKSYSEIALEMRLLRYELQEVQTNPNKAKGLIHPLNDISRVFSGESPSWKKGGPPRQHPWRKDLVA